MMEDKIFTEEIAVEIKAKLNAGLAEISPFRVYTQFFTRGARLVRSDAFGDLMEICVVKRHCGMEYACCIMMRDPNIDYAPQLLGWWAEITEKLEKADNRSAA